MRVVRLLVWSGVVLGGCRTLAPPFPGQEQVIQTTAWLWDGVNRADAFERAHQATGTRDSAFWGVSPARRAFLDQQAAQSLARCQAVPPDHPVCELFRPAITAWRAEEAPVTWAEHHSPDRHS